MHEEASDPAEATRFLTIRKVNESTASTQGAVLDPVRVNVTELLIISFSPGV